MRLKEDPTRCSQDVWKAWGEHQCPNKIKYPASGKCGVHDLEQKAKRAKARGPTRSERELRAIDQKAAALARERADAELIRKTLHELLQAIERDLVDGMCLEGRHMRGHVFHALGVMNRGR